MKRVKARQTYSLFILLLSGFLIAGCGDGAKNGHWLPGGAASTADVTRPTVTAVLPLDNAVGVARNTKITAAFSEAMAPLTLIDNTIDNTTTFTVTDNASGLLVPGTVTYSGVTAVYRPTNPLAASTLHTARISTAATDLAGNALAANYIWRFTTGATSDNTAPTVILTYPVDNATGVATNSAVSATFSEAMDPATIDNATFTVRKVSDNSAVSGTVVYRPLDNLATFTPTGNLADNTAYRATITNGAMDLAGNALVVPAVTPKPNPWTFTTGAGTAAASAVPLGSAAGFGIMATSAITNTGAATMINGDVSLDPGSSCGLLPVQVNGTIHINDTVSALARADLLAAYNTAKGLPPGTTISAGADLGALYPSGIPPGTYTSGSTMSVNTALVLDAGGNANAVWVFQIGSSLTTTTPLGNVTLANGAQAKNVFWVPTASATIGVGTTFHGTIIAGVSATGQTGATINGRILAGAIGPGTIALDTNTVTVPAP
jgi:hypothetical protein